MNNNNYSDYASDKPTCNKKKLKSKKKPKYNLSKIKEYENYLDNLRMMSRGGEVA